MKERTQNICPCCPKGCDLNEPRCECGEVYLRTGTIPERGGAGHGHEKHRHPGCEEMGIDGQLFILLGKLGRMGHSAFDGKSSQNRILSILSKTEHMTQRELTEQLGIRPGSASEIIKKLESAGWILRESNDEDRRTVNISLTDAGKVRVEEHAEQFGSTNQELFDCLSEEEKQQLLSLLQKLSQNWHGRFHGHCTHHGHPGKGSHGHRHGEDSQRPRKQEYKHGW